MQEKELRILSGLLQKARDRNELETLLRGVLTPQEIDEIVLRWELLVRLLNGETQRQISQKLGVSLGKIARGSRLLKYGTPDFRELVERIIGGNPEPDR